MLVDPLVPYFCGVALVVLLVGLGMRALRQPYVLAYIVAGVVIGPHVLAHVCHLLT